MRQEKRKKKKRYNNTRSENRMQRFFNSFKYRVQLDSNEGEKPDPWGTLKLPKLTQETG
jgi:hypothetical protein